MASSTSLSEWYSSLLFRWVDLVGDYAGNEIFIIEGDSLLLNCFIDQRIDFEDGFQLLHAAYVVEAFLENLKKRGCRFHVVFFENHAHLCLPESSKHDYRYLLARNAIIRHLQLYISNVSHDFEIHVFSDLKSVAFQEYLKISSAYFVACCDGAFSFSLDEPSLSGNTSPDHKSKLSNGSREAGAEQNRSYLRAIIFWFMDHGLNVALLNGIDFRDSKVMSFVMESEHQHTELRHELQSNFLDVYSKLGHNLEKTTDPPDKETNTHDAHENLAAFVRKRNPDFPVTPRISITMQALVSMSATKEMEALGAPFVLHTILLRHLPLSQRRFSLVKFDEQGEKSYDTFLQCFCREAQAIIKATNQNDGKSNDIVDLVDGRLFRAVLGALAEKRVDIDNLPAPMKEEYHLLLSFLDIQVSLEATVLKILAKPAAAPQMQNDDGDLSIMPFSHPHLDAHLASIHVKVDTTPDDFKCRGKIYRELTHWHNKSLIASNKRRVLLDPKVEARRLRSNQRYMAETHAYAASLTNATGKVLDAELIIVGTDKTRQANQASAKGPKEQGKTTKQIKGGGSKNKKGSSTKAAMHEKVAQDLAEKKKKKADSASSAWTKYRTDTLDKIHDPLDRYARTVSYYNEASQQRDLEALAPELELYKLSVLLRSWREASRSSSTKSRSYHIAALILVTMHQITQMSCTAETLQILKDVAKYLQISWKTRPKAISKDAASSNFSFLFSPLNIDMSLGTNAQQFSLLQVGPYMDRDMDSADDPRVLFRPDGWQRNVLDELDAMHSVFVVAPTSSGKTFISFYAMEKVLRASDDGVVVYVAPTKALVNQIAAEVVARFKKNYKHAGTTLYAIHTRDYRVNNPTQCQVLVTVPHMLQIMLLSPSNARNWAPRIKTIIFDEVHCIGQAEDGVIWEQLLLMAPCQIIALSATVGNPTAFTDWLSTSQKSTKLGMIEVSHRFSDLRKFFFVPPEDFSFSGLPRKPVVPPLGLDCTEGFSYMHPVVSLTDRKRGIPDDLALESHDCLLLFQAMAKHQTEKFPVPSDLSPEKFLPEDNIQKAHVLRWGARLKELLGTWMKDLDSPYENVHAEISRGLFQNTKDVHAFDRTELEATMLPLLTKLQETGALPAICFSFDRTTCEDMATSILSRLKESETQWKSTNPLWQSRIKGWEAWKETKDSKSKKRPEVKKARNSKQKEEDGDTAKTDPSLDESYDSNYAYFNPLDPCDEFSFADPRKFNRDELEQVFRAFRWRGINEDLIDAFRRGIGVHHSGMNRKYRQAVESWFRRGFIQVVFATGTLALGINMPCKTVVFSGDSVYLTALNFRQAAGRSGRRGFDLLGNVVFHGISVNKACRLISSRIPDLNGHFPLTTTLVLRLLNLLHESKQAPFAVHAVDSLLSQPRLLLGGESFKHQVLHHLRFSIEYLRVQGLVGPHGEPLNLTSLVSHLYHTENSAFAFHALLREGYFHQLAKELADHEIETLETLMIVMANLFGRQPLRNVDEETTKKSSSIVFLPPLPDEASKVLEQHNEETLRTFHTYVRTYAEQYFQDKEDNTLPFTHISPGGTEGNLFDRSVLPSALPPTVVRSPFFALSNHSDLDFTSLTDLCTSVRNGIFLERAVIPYLPFGNAEVSNPLNAYLLDFYKHGSVRDLEVGNKIRRGDIWFVLNDFSLVLATIVTSLEGFISGSNHDDMAMAEITGLGDRKNIEQDEIEAGTLAEEEKGQAASASVTVQKPAAINVKTKKKIVDSWADEEISSSEDEETPSESSSTPDFDEAEGLKSVLHMFKKLRQAFDDKFFPIFA
ncbi:MAG: hypothetical protein M1834_004867 [Cirrosporium novae-zelandiae]|nr:MAG: hypothetical protein M1834_004867 [Cirrosporium novae-zelandiae]